MAYHLLLPGRLIGGLPARVAARGYLAVDVFFVLSGFVIALSYGQLFAGRFRLASFSGFLWRRVARLYPLYGAILAGRLAYTGWRYGSFNLPRPWIAAPLPHPWTDIPANALLMQSWGVAPSSIGPAWSISTEWAAYWAFPMLAVLVLHGNRRAALAGAAGAVALLLATAGLLHREGQPNLLDAWDGETAGPLMRCLAGFILGLVVRRLAAWPPASRLAARPAAGFAVMSGLAVLLAIGAPDLLVYPLFPALVLCLACAGGGPARAFSLPPVVWLGNISYSLYLLHIFLLHPLDQARAVACLFLPASAADAASAALVLAFLLAASDVSYRCVERPSRRLLAG